MIVIGFLALDYIEEWFRDASPRARGTTLFNPSAFGGNSR